MNNPTPSYIWYLTTGNPLPTGSLSSVLIQPYDNGHPPMPGPSREVFVRIGFDYRRQTSPRVEP